RYFIEADGQTLGLAETVSDATGHEAFGQINYGPFVHGTAEALRSAALTTDTDVEVRLLHIPALYLIALWLHREGQPATLVPAAPTPPGVDANRSYESDMLLRLLAAQAGQLGQGRQNDDRGN